MNAISFTIATGYTVKESQTSSLDLLAGARYLGVDVDTGWDLTVAISAPGGEIVLPAQGSVGKDVDLWDAIIGVRGKTQLKESKWAVQYYLDAGAGSSDLTWQAMAGFSRTSDWGELILVYRHLEYDEGSDGLLQNFSFSGPAIGARFSF